MLSPRIRHSNIKASLGLRSAAGVHRHGLDVGPTLAGRANASVAAPHAEMRCFPAPPAMPVPPAVPAVPTMTRAWFGYPHWAAPSWRPDLSRCGGKGRAEERQQTDDCRRQHLHHARGPATRLRSRGWRLALPMAERVVVGAIGSTAPAPTDQIANSPHIQILCMSNSGMRCAGERAGAL